MSLLLKARTFCFMCTLASKIFRPIKVFGEPWYANLEPVRYLTDRQTATHSWFSTDKYQGNSAYCRGWVCKIPFKWFIQNKQILVTLLNCLDPLNFPNITNKLLRTSQICKVTNFIVPFNTLKQLVDISSH